MVHTAFLACLVAAYAKGHDSNAQIAYSCGSPCKGQTVSARRVYYPSRIAWPATPRQSTTAAVTSSLEPFGSDSVGNADHGQDYLRKHTLTVTRVLGGSMLAVEYDSSTAVAVTTQARMSQTMSSAALTLHVGKDTSATVGFREVNGWGGPLTPGASYTASLRERLSGGSTLKLELASPTSTNPNWLRLTLVSQIPG